MKAAANTLALLASEGHQRAAIPTMMTRAELYDLLDYRGYEERDQRFFQ
jgi:methylisocitrate lyase